MSLQTLHPTSFDEGVVLDQTPWPGIDVPEDCDYAKLLEILQPLGAEMLVNAIQTRLYVPPYIAIHQWLNDDDGRHDYKHAPKVGTTHRLLRFDAMTSSHIVRMSRTFDSTWAYAAVPTLDGKPKRQRVIFQGPFGIVLPSSHASEEKSNVPEVPPGLPYSPHDAANSGAVPIDGPLFVNTVDGGTISVKSMKVEGGIQMPAYRAALKHRLIGQTHKTESRSAITFHDVLTADP